ncbi:hypothetical protein BGO17_04295 [Candidatus Saccharibacteria bacterium 49-20]|nr:MAG: hypothetical protein BGO17_04295 [Candidatus Saccharibacteria bacterium 49-20]
MKIQKSKNKKRLPLVIILSLLLLIAIPASVYAYVQFKDGKSNTPKVLHESDKEQSQNLKDNPDDKQQSQNTDKPSTPETVDESTGKQQVQLEASSDKSNNTVYIRGGINYPVSGGRCFATLTGPTGQTVTKETSLLQGPASTDCQTISIPVSELTAGTWSFKLQYESDKYIGASNSVTFSI